MRTFRAVANSSRAIDLAYPYADLGQSPLRLEDHSIKDPLAPYLSFVFVYHHEKVELKEQSYYIT